MNIQELATIVKNKLNIKIFVLNNDGYLLIRHTQKKYFGRVNGESPKTGLGFPDLQDIAKAYGIRYENENKMKWSAETKWVDETIADTVARVLKGKDPVLCEIKTPRWEKSQGRLDDLSKSALLTTQTY